MSFNIAIDGPAGAGKSTVARRAAAMLGFTYVDTGAMYRTIGLYLMRNHVDPADSAALADALGKIKIGMSYADGVQHMSLNGEDVSSEIRTQEVGEMASRSAAVPAVRDKLLSLQQELAASQDVLMDGRDIGTRILPNAQLKIYLTAGALVRARRRFLELEAKGETADIAQIEEEIRSRDYRDMHREIAPLAQAEDAVYLDTSNLTIEEASAVIVTLAKLRMGRAD